MANVDCMPTIEPDDKEIVIKADDGPPTKKMKQGRLPFKPLDHSGHTRQSNTPPGSKKRKLSGNESPSAKQLKTGLSSSNLSNPVLSGEHEVSSSSETEILADLQNKNIKKLNTIDKFFRPKPSVKDQEEISSTNEDIEIDLTHEESDKENPETTLPDDSKEQVHSPDCVTIETKVCDNAENKAVDKNDVEDENEDKSVNEDKENVSDIDADSSFITNTSVCEDALKTPVKSTLESVLKTPVTSSSSGDISQGSAGEGTPVSGQKTKRSAMSESKRKEREAQRQKAKEDKERQKEEQRLQKEREKEEKKKELLAKKKQKEEQKEKERLERERLRQEDKEKKEKERLDKIKQKEELRKQKEKELESKNEEKRKKEEERKQKEEEKRQREEEKRKEEEEKQRKADKKKEMFKGFFIQKEPTVSPPKIKEMKNGLFMPFELKANMKLAPSRRNPLTVENKQTVDEFLQKQDCDNLYLNTVKSSTLGKSYKTWPKREDDNDIEIMSHEKETIERVTYRAKFLHFHENTRPAYYGTWRKKSQRLSPRNPFKQDEDLFDYEIDSDDEWEEEEPGESVSSDEDDDETEKIDDEDGDVDDWMVPHGYLSDDEGVKDEEEVDAASKQDLQRVRQAAWESELKRQAKPLKMLAIGCNWENDDTTTIAAQQLQTLLKYKAVCLLDGPIPTSYTVSRSCDTESTETNDKTEERSSKKKCVPEEAMKDLIRLIHGNPVGIKKLMKEFLAYWRKKNNPDLDVTADATLDTSKLEMSMEVDEKSDPNTDLPKVPNMNTSLVDKTDTKINYGISKRQLEIKILAIAVYEKRSNNNNQKGKCWYIKDETLEQYEMKDLQLPNTWEYVCIKPPPQPVDKTATPKVEESSKTSAAKTGSDTPKIMKFAQPMSPSKIQALGAISSNTSVTPSTTSSNIEEQSNPDQDGPAASLNVAKVTVPADQRRIKDMFTSFNKNQSEVKPDSKLTPSNVNTPTETSKAVLPDANKLTNINIKPINKVSLAEKVKSSSSVSKPAAMKELILSCSGSKETPTKPSSGMNALKTFLSSPELMKSSETKKVDKEVVEDVTNKEQPMDVDIIVLD
ncbi:Chromatin assembly factor 1 [Mactra antiquata]